MNRYQLATLVEWAGELHTRKRLQKVIYLLQAAGAPIEADFTLHYYGPYSYDVAQLTDEMVRAGLLEETSVSNLMGGASFRYSLSDTARTQLADLGDATTDAEWLGFNAQAKSVLLEDLTKLEFAATIAFFYKRIPRWKLAREAAARFKNQPADSATMIAAEELARQIVATKDAD